MAVHVGVGPGVGGDFESGADIDQLAKMLVIQGVFITGQFTVASTMLQGAPAPVHKRRLNFGTFVPFPLMTF